MTLSVRQLEERIVAAIEALDATDYGTPSVPAEWKESDRWVPNDPEASLTTQHLGFVVWTDESPAPLDRQTSPGVALLRSRVGVTFHFVASALGHQPAEARKARDAAQDVTAAVLALEDDDLSIVVVNGGRARDVGFTGSDMIVPVRVEFDALHEIDITPPAAPDEEE
jgi:hypothetical protein